MTQVRKRPRRAPSSPRLAAACERPIDGLLEPALFKALGDPTRAALVRCIAKCARPCTVGEIAECCSVDLSVVSRHLSLLADAGVLESVKEGRTVRYAVRFAHVGRALRDLADALDQCCAGEEGGCCGKR